MLMLSSVTAVMVLLHGQICREKHTVLSQDSRLYNTFLCLYHRLRNRNHRFREDDVAENDRVVFRVFCYRGSVITVHMGSVMFSLQNQHLMLVLE